MRHLLQDMPVAEFLQHVQRRLSRPAIADVTDWRRYPTPALAHIGIHAQRQAGLCYVGAVPKLGRIDVAQLRTLADIADTSGDGTLRLTPRQSVLLPNIPKHVADAVARDLQTAGFAIDTREPLAQVIACSGFVDCVKGRADTKADALLLASLLRQAPVQIGVHLTGCERSCAAAHVAPFTLLAVAEGHYDVYRHNADAGLGELIARSVDINQAAALIIQRA
jgi:precorrin-3B synthase